MTKEIYIEFQSSDDWNVDYDYDKDDGKFWNGKIDSNDDGKSTYRNFKVRDGKDEDHVWHIK